MVRGKILLFCVLFISASVVSLHGQGIDNPIAARDHVVTDFLKGDLAAKRILVHPELLAPHVSIQGWHETALTTPSEGYVVFIDDKAFANFEHPCRYVFVDRETGAFQVAGGTTPPKDISRWLEMETRAFRMLMSAKNVRASRTIRKHAPQRSSRGGELYAVLMSGGISTWYNYVRYWNDLSNIYITLKDVYGYKDENIYVLCSDGLDPTPDQSNGQNSDPDLDGDGDDDIMYSCTYPNVQCVFERLRDKLTKEDQLFIFTTDHGGSVSGWHVCMNLWHSAKLHDFELEAMLATLPECDIITTMEQCSSGGFMDNLSHTYGRVFSSACAFDEPSYGMLPHLLYDTYAFFWTAAVKGEDAFGNPVDADSNADGKISMREAFLFAEEHDLCDETPQYNDTPTGYGEELTLSAPSDFCFVPSDFPTIQAAIDASANMTRIRVEAGVYRENIDFSGKEIIIESVGGPKETIIDGMGLGSVVVFGTGETGGSMLKGFTIRNGSFKGGDPCVGAGICCSNASPTIRENIIVNNGEGDHTLGGGIGCVSSCPVIINCVIDDNIAYKGGGIYCDASSPELINCTVSKNTATVNGGGVLCEASADPVAVNCILWGNLPDQITAPFTASIGHSDIQGGYPGSGNIDQDPLWEPGWNLDRNSPCINRGDIGAVSNAVFDLNGNDRVINGIVDMGACEGEDCILTSDQLEMDPNQPESIFFTFDFGVDYAKRSYLLTGSASGFAPGIDINGITIPLKWDAYTSMVMENLNSNVFIHFAGSLDAAGKGSAMLFWAGGGMPSLVGVTLYHVAFTMNPIDMTSNPLPLLLTDQ